MCSVSCLAGRQPNVSAFGFATVAVNHAVLHVVQPPLDECSFNKTGIGARGPNENVPPTNVAVFRAKLACRPTGPTPAPVLTKAPRNPPFNMSILVPVLDLLAYKPV